MYEKTWVSLNNKVKNEIDHLLINNLTIMKNSEILSRFEFSSDHRIGRCCLQIPKRSEYKKWKNKSTTKKMIIPIHKTSDAGKFLEGQSRAVEGSAQSLEVQELYNSIERAIKETEERFGKEREKIRTDDKLDKRTKELIEKREKMRLLVNPSTVQRIELSELSKLVKREIKKDSRNYEEEQVKEIIEESWSTRRLKREISKGTKIMMGVRDKKIKLVTGRDKIIQVITKFFRELL